MGIGLEDVELVPPVTLVKEQAGLLARKTKYVITGEIDTSFSGDQVIHTFLLVAPALDNYRYFLFRFHHGIEFYPVYIFWNNEHREASSEDWFVKLLGEILSSDSTLKVITSLLAQSRV